MIPLPASLKSRVKSALLKRWGLEPPDPFVDLGRIGSVSHVVDGGAHVGGTARLFRRVFPGAKVWCFEPDPENLSKLREVSGIEIQPYALSDSTGPKTFHRNITPGGHSLLELNGSAQSHMNVEVRQVGTYQVQAVSLDEWTAQQGIKIDILKLDIQGGELAALKGAERTLKTCRAVLAELHFLPIYSGAPTADEVWSFLRLRGLRLYRLYETWEDREGQLIQGDGLFLR